MSQEERITATKVERAVQLPEEQQEVEIQTEVQREQTQLYNRKITGQNTQSHNKASHVQIAHQKNEKTEKQAQVSNSPQQSDDIEYELANQEHSIQDTTSTNYSVNTRGKTQLNQQISFDIQLYEPPSQKHLKYGNLTVFCESKYFLCNIGPNYFFFLIAYLCFTAATIYLVGLVNSSMKNDYFKIFNFIFCWLQNVSYLLVALSNPGISLPTNDLLVTEQQLKNKRFCKTCGIIQKRKTYHCRECDICIDQYDHHCPWTSKCIGKGNLNRFYMFVCLTPFYIFYYMVVFMICMASLTVTHNKHLKTHTF